MQPLSLEAFGRRLWTIPPNSQGYLALAGAWIAEQVGVPVDPAEEAWAFVLVEAARQAAHDRLAVLHESADGAALISPERLAPRAEAIGGGAGRGLADVYGDGDTTYLCAVDGDRTGVSLIMSNAAGFGAHLVLTEHGILLHNRGMGFSLTDGHPAEFGPGRRPPHTLSPLAVTREDGGLHAVIGSMGGDAQPQIVLQLLARTLIAGEDPGTAVGAPRWSLTREESPGFDAWETTEPPIVALEHGRARRLERGLAPPWLPRLARPSRRRRLRPRPGHPRDRRRHAGRRRRPPPARRGVHRPVTAPRGRLRPVDLGIQGRVALVGGASQGIGRAVAEALVAEGARVVITSRNAERIAQVATDIGAAAGLAWDSADLDAAPGCSRASPRKSARSTSSSPTRAVRRPTPIRSAPPPSNGSRPIAPSCWPR